MNNEIDREQLDTNTSVHSAAADSDMEGTASIVTSSQYGKFKDADSLYKAYNELQSEFTRKCQRLSELEQKSQDNAVIAPSENETSWQDQVGDFIKNHRLAKLYSKEISNELLNDDSLKNNKHGLEIAYSKVLESKFKSNEEIINDEAFLNDYVFNNENIKKQIINNYINSLNKVPTVLSSGASMVTFAPTHSPTSLEEAKSMVEDMLKD